jgi:hypothetical protein
MRDLQQNSCTVPRTGVTPLSPSMIQILEDFKSLLHDIVRFSALDVRDEPDPTSIFFVSWIVETLGVWKAWYVHASSIVLNKPKCQENIGTPLGLFDNKVSQKIDFK